MRIFPKVLVMIFFLMKAAAAADSLIYISEPIIENDIKTAKTLISAFKFDGTKQKEVLVNGFLASVSPDGKYIVYLEHKEKFIWEAALADSDGRKIRNLSTFAHPSHRTQVSTCRLIWSPDNNKIAILQVSQGTVINEKQRGTPVLLNVVDLKTDKINGVYSGLSATSELPYSYSIIWFPDNKRMLFAGSEGTMIIDTESRNTQIISKDFMKAYLVENGRKIAYFNLDTGERKTDKPSAALWLYNIEANSSQLIMKLDNQPTSSAINRDGRYLSFLSLSGADRVVFVADLRNKKLTQLNAKNLILLPRMFSPFSDDLVFCLGFKKNEASTQFGILNLKSSEFQMLKKSSEKGLGGEGALMSFLLFDWYDWR